MPGDDSSTTTSANSQPNTTAKPILTILLKGTFPENLRFVENLLQPLGLLLANPDSGLITHWSDDGRQVAVSRAAIVDEVSAGVMKNVQFWETGCEDLFVSWLDVSSGWEFSFHLDGVTPTLKIALATVLSNAVLIDLQQHYQDETVFRIDFDEPSLSRI
ncbi:hypothetical protein PQQ60_30565 [Paraburkholderia strydomiana]